MIVGQTVGNVLFFSRKEPKGRGSARLILSEEVCSFLKKTKNGGSAIEKLLSVFLFSQACSRKDPVRTSFNMLPLQISSAKLLYIREGKEQNLQMGSLAELLPFGSFREKNRILPVFFTGGYGWLRRSINIQMGLLIRGSFNEEPHEG
jgi:hypothetical protein